MGAENLNDTEKLVGELEKGVAALDGITKSVSDANDKIGGIEKKLAESEMRVKAFEEEMAKLKSSAVLTSEKSASNHDGEIVKQFKDMMHNQFAKGLNEGTPAAGGYFVPEELSNYIIDSVARYGFLRKFGNIFPMKREKLHVQNISGITAVVVAEAIAGDKQTPTVGRVTFDVKKIMSLIPVSSEFQEDADIGSINKVIELMGVAIATREDIMMFTANGEADNGSKTGLLYDTDIPSVTMGTGSNAFAYITWDNLSDMIDSVSTPEVAGTQMRFFMHRTIRGILRTLADTATFGSPFKASGGEVETLWGYPITWLNIMPSNNLSSQAATPFVLFGDPYYFGLGDRRQISVKMSDQLYFDSDQIAMRAIERCDTQLLDDNAVVRLITAS